MRSPIAPRLGRNSLILLVSNIGSAGLSFLLSVLIGRGLGQEGLGIYAAALAWVFPLSLAADFGLGTLLSRDLAQNPAAERDYLRAATLARLWLGGGLTLALLFGAPLLSNEAEVALGLRLSAPLIIILPFFGTFTALFRARQVMWPIPWLNLGMLAAQVALTALVLIGGGGVRDALAVNTLTSAGQLVAAWGVWRWRFRGSVGATYRSSLRLSVSIAILLRRAWPFAVAAILAAAQARLGMILLERLTDTAEVGYYAAATRFVEAGRMIPNALFGALFPALAALAGQPAELNRLFRRALLGLGAFGALLGVAFSLSSAFLLDVTYGAAFAPATQVLQIAMWSLLPGLLRAGGTLYWYARGREALVNTASGLMLLIQLGASLWLIPVYGATGAAAASLLTEIAFVILLGIIPLKAREGA